MAGSLQTTYGRQGNTVKQDNKSSKADYSLYMTSAEEYDRIRFSGWAGNWGHKRQIDILHGLADDWHAKKVLEIGCGTGRVTEMLLRWGADVTATDISKPMLDVARKRLSVIPDHSKCTLREMCIFDIDINLECYDYIVMINVLGRLTNAQIALMNIASRMTAGTHLVFTFPCLTSLLLPFGLLVNARGRSLYRNATSHWYRPKTIRRMCEAAELTILQFHGNHYVPVPRLLFWTLPVFWSFEKMLASRFPLRCPSVFAICKPV